MKTLTARAGLCVSMVFLLGAAACGSDSERSVSPEENRAVSQAVDLAIPVRELLEVTAGGAAAGELLGDALLLDGDLAFVGAPGRGIAGEVLVFGRDQGGQDRWGRVARLVPSDGAAGDGFGSALAKSGDLVVVGAPAGDGRVANTGAAYVFDVANLAPGATLQEQIKLQASAGTEARDAAAGDGFGGAVAMDGARVLVGAIDGANETNNVNSSGAAYVFDLGAFVPGEPLVELARLEGSDVDNNSEDFGFAVALQGDRALVSARVGDGRVADTGVVYVFDLAGVSQGDLRLQAGFLQAGLGAESRNAQVGDQFGFSLAMSGDRVAVGAINGGNEAHNTNNAGSVFIFDMGAFVVGDRDVELARLEASDGDSDTEEFGSALSIAGDRLLVGAQRATGQVTDTGFAYLFSLTGLQLAEVRSQLQGFSSSNGVAADRFGAAVALSEGAALVGAPQADAEASNSGAFYVFERSVVVSLAASGNMDEAGGQSLITVTLSEATTDAVGVTLAFSGQAQAGVDFAAEPAALTFEPGQTELSVALTAIDDDLGEGNERVVVRLGALENAADFGARAELSIVDDEPLGRPDAFIVSRGSTGNAFDVLVNDQDFQGRPLTLVAVGQPDNGGIATVRNGLVFYSPDPAFSGTESFTYTLSNGVSQSQARVTVTVPAFCSGASDLVDFAVQQEWVSANGGGADRGSAVVADLNGDGAVEILIETGGDANISPRVNIFNGVNVNEATPVDAIVLNTNKMANIALADVDGNGSIEVIVADTNRRIHVFTGFNGGQSPMTRLVQSVDLADNLGGASPGSGPGQLHVADLNQDGRPEIISGNNVFAFTGDFGGGDLALVKAATGGATRPAGSGAGSSTSRNFNIGTTVAVDILPDSFCATCQGLEIVAGQVVYAVDGARLASPSGSPEAAMVVAADLNAIEGLNNVFRDGPVAIADLDLDGDLDSAVAGTKSGVGFGVYVWNPFDGEVAFMAVPNSNNDVSGPIIANVFLDRADPALSGVTLDMPEVIVVSTTRISAVNVQKGATFWSEVTTDTSGSTGITVFDFNGDGIKEIVYRDEQVLRVMYGGAAPFPAGVDTSRNWVRFTGVTSGTGHEQAIVADVDNDGEAEIVTTGANRLRVFGRGGAARWIPARKIWNQYNYFSDNVADDAGLIPRVQADSARIVGAGTQRPFNAFKEQSVPLGAAPGTIDPGTGLLFPPVAPDAVLTLVSVTPQGECNQQGTVIEVVVQIENRGDDLLNADTPVTFYRGDPRFEGAVRISTEVLGEAIPVGGTRQLTVSLPDQGGAFALVAIFNDRGTLEPPFEVPAFVQGECSLVNNVDIDPNVCNVDSDGDGVPDGVDADDDNDGVLDLDELGGVDVTGDTDGDNAADWRDPDSPGFVDADIDGTDDRFDFDGDGVPNHIDVDADNDGILDIVEGGGGDLDADGDGRADDLTDADGDGLLAAFDADDGDPDNVAALQPARDTDGDGLPDSLELDADGDGLFDLVESGQPDLNGDGLVDAFTDDDGDGLASTVDPSEGGQRVNPVDFDGDGRFDFQDVDDDGDTILTFVEVNDSDTLGDDDVDGDDLLNWLDVDSDGVGESDGVEGIGDVDGDGVPNYLDPDDNDGPDGDLDGDGLSNGVEAQIGTNPLDRDSDGDGIGDFVEADGGSPVDTDGDDLIDARDPDSDGDGILDNVEGAADLADGGDGLGNWRDRDSDGDGRDDAVEGLVDSDGDDTPDYLDPDDDGDGVPTIEDNCPLTLNSDQLDTDDDGTGDACDVDDDGDGDEDEADNCPLVVNADQADADNDGVGDACEGDADGDGVRDDLDNCPAVSNADQTNTDFDAQGDACDPDDDDDDILDGDDNCPLVSNEEQSDTDGDGLGDACDDDDDNDGLVDREDNCPFDANADQANLDGDLLGDVCDPDDDNDRVEDDRDNCPLVANADQADVDNNGVGDVCEGDADGDGVTDDLDNCIVVPNGDQADQDGDGQGDVCDEDIDGDGLDNDEEEDIGTDPADGDSDDDGVRDGDEGGEDGEPGDDPDGDGLVNALDPDSDDDGILDGTELGLTEPDADTDEEAGNFVPDADPDTTTDPVVADTDGGGLDDGVEDANQDGRIDDGEGDPNDPTDDVVADSDGDGIPDDVDNCPEIPNADQADEDGNGIGDACDPGRVGEPCEEGVGECRAEGTLQLDEDGAIVCSATPGLPGDEADERFLCDGLDNDCDGEIDEALDCDGDDDGILDGQDNCPEIANPDQADSDSDGTGDACEDDPPESEVAVEVIGGSDCLCQQPGAPAPRFEWLTLFAVLGVFALRRRLAGSTAP